MYVTIAVSFAMAIAGLVAWLFRRPMIFPSLGPSVFLFVESPMEPEASPRNALVGHGVALAVGTGLLLAFGLPHTGHFGTSFSARRALAAGLSVGITEGLLVLVRSPHVPAGATALMVTLGLLPRPSDTLALALGLVLATAAVWALNRSLGIPVPRWAPVFRSGAAPG